MPGEEHSRLGTASEALRPRWAEGAQGTTSEQARGLSQRGAWRPPGKDVALLTGLGSPRGL